MAGLESARLTAEQRRKTDDGWQFIASPVSSRSLRSSAVCVWLNHVGYRNVPVWALGICTSELLCH
jgi:hypothetical protein